MLRYFLLIFSQLVFHTLFAQLPVHQEPRHKPVFQNEKIRILDVNLPPGDTTQYHLHHTPSVFLFFTSTTTGSQLKGDAPASGSSVSGTILYEDLAAPHERIHRVWNTDKTNFHVMDVEILTRNFGFSTARPTNQSLQLVVDTAWVRVYRLRLDRGNEFSLAGERRSLALVALSPTRVVIEEEGRKREQRVSPGTYFWLKAGGHFSMANKESTVATFALLEPPAAKQ